MKRKKIIQNILLQILVVWGLASIVICAGEEIPGQTMSDALFFWTKIIGIVSLWLCFITGRYLNRNGWLPEIKDED